MKGRSSRTERNSGSGSMAALTDWVLSHKRLVLGLWLVIWIAATLARSWSRKTSVAVIAPSRLVSTMRRCSSRWSEAKGAVSMTPALLTRMLAPPSSCCTRSAAVRPRPS